MLRRLSFTLVIICALSLVHAASWAQETSVSAEEVYKEPPGWQVGVSTGPFLPNKIARVKEILPFWGLSISTDLSVFRPEFTLLQGHGKGHDWYMGMFSFRNELPMYGMQFFWSWGFQVSYYTQLLYNVLPTDFVTNGGLHGGVGAMWPITDKLRFRADTIFFFGPGKALYVGLGLQRSF